LARSFFAHQYCIVTSGNAFKLIEDLIEVFEEVCICDCIRV